MRFLTWGTCFILYILFENHLNVWLSVSMDWFARFSLYIYCPCIHIMQNFWTLWSLSTSQRRVPFSINGQTKKKKTIRWDTYPEYQWLDTICGFITWLDIKYIGLDMRGSPRAQNHHLTSIFCARFVTVTHFVWIIATSISQFFNNSSTPNTKSITNFIKCYSNGR